MPEISKSYQLEYDIDWFFQSDNRLFHCVANCSMIPHKFADHRDLRLAQEMEAYLLGVITDEDIRVNEVYNQLYVVLQIERLEEVCGNHTPISPNESREIHLSLFKTMASKGLWSFDHTMGMENNQYTIVAYFSLVTWTTINFCIDHIRCNMESSR